MKLIYHTIIIILILSSCETESVPAVEDSSVTNSKDQIAQLEKEITQLSAKPDASKEIDQKRLQLNDSLLAFYNNHPDDAYAADCLEKLHMSFIIQRDYRSAITYGELLINNYPEHPNRLIFIESLANIYDMDIKPRSKEKVKYYLELLLKDYPEMDEEKKADIQYRLDNIDLSIEQIMHQQLQ